MKKTVVISLFIFLSFMMYSQGFIIKFPHNGAVLEIGNSYKVTWIQTDKSIGKVKVNIFKNSINRSNLIQQLSGPNSGILNWDITNKIVPGNYFLRIKGQNSKAYTDSNIFYVREKNNVTRKTIRNTFNNRNILTNQSNRNLSGRSTPLPKFKPLPDLELVNIFRGSDCKVFVVIRNNGPGKLDPQAYHPTNGVVVQMFRNGKAWGGDDLNTMDKGKVLTNPGGEILWKWLEGWATLPSAEGEMKCIVDYHSIEKESNENNNTLVRKLKCN